MTEIYIITVIFLAFIFFEFGFFKIFRNDNMKSKIQLPSSIDYTKYNSTQGMATSIWGPCAWDFLFTSIMGRYPMEISTKEDINIGNKFSSMLRGLKDTMPCVYCRKSFEIFIKELPIEPYLVGRIELMFWLYLIKDKVNVKLERQEEKCYNDEKIRLKGLYHNGNISEQEYYYKVNKFKKETLITVPTPPFKEVLDKYENNRAQCSPKAMKCSKPKDDEF